MGIAIPCLVVGGFLYYFEIRRPEVYLKESRKARLGMDIIKWAIIIGCIALAIMFGNWFTSHLV